MKALRIRAWLMVGAAVASVLVGTSARADDAVCPAPQCVRDQLTFDGRIERFNVVLPPGYSDDGNTRRYPVLYLLHGGLSEDQDTWLTQTDLLGFVRAQPAAAQAIVVMPDGGHGDIYSDSRNGTLRWETLHVGVLIPYVDVHYRTLADRSHRAVAGLSAGGFGSLHYAARHPDLYVASAAFSGVVDIMNPAFLATLGTAVVAYGVAGCTAGDPGGVTGVCSGYKYSPGEPVGASGDYVTDEVWWRGNNPTDLAPNFSGISLYVSAGTGTPCDAVDADPAQYDDGARSETPLLLGAESMARDMASHFDDALTRATIRHVSQFNPCGVHTWRYFQAGLHAFWPQMTRAFGTAPPPSFSFRFVEPTFSVWGWTFTADSERAAEFLDVSGASNTGVGLTGSGLATVTTAPLFAPGQRVALTGATIHEAIADRAGGIQFTVDLGPPHTMQQYTPAARALEAAGGYFTSRVVRFDPLP